MPTTQVRKTATRGQVINPMLKTARAREVSTIVVPPKVQTVSLFDLICPTKPKASPMITQKMPSSINKSELPMPQPKTEPSPVPSKRISKSDSADNTNPRPVKKGTPKPGSALLHKKWIRSSKASIQKSSKNSALVAYNK